jgi:hypothetical protein
MITNFPELLRILVLADIEFIVVGGAAATAHGSPRITRDLDIVYRRTSENLDRIVKALAPLDPYPRGAPPGLPFKWDRRTVEFGLNFTLDISLGAIDILGEIAGGGTYDELLPHSISVDLYGIRCRCLDLDTLIYTKRAAGRPKDFDAIADLEAIREEQQGRSAE